MEHSTPIKHTKSSMIQLSQENGFFTSLDEALGADVSEYQGNCSQLFQIRSSLSNYLSQMSNYTPQSMGIDIDRLQSARTLVSQVVASLDRNTPSLVQLNSKAQLQDTLAVMDKLKSMSLVSQVSVNDVRTQVSELLSSSNLQAQVTEAASLLDSLESIISQVSSVQSQLFSIDDIHTLESKRKEASALIQAICFNDINPVANISEVNTRDSTITSGRRYRSADEPTQSFSATGVNVTEDRLRDIVIGGWVRWLEFVNNTHNNDGKESVIFRLTSKNATSLEEDLSFSDRHAILYASSSYYRLCIHDTTTEDINVCHTFNFSGLPRENEWHFFLFMYSYNNKTALARVRLSSGNWVSYTFPWEITQVPFQGQLTLFLGNDAFTTTTTGWNGEMAGWNLFYGYNAWQSQTSAWLESAAETISKRYFQAPKAVPYVELDVNPNSVLQKHTSNDESLFTYVNTFFEAEDYGFGVWFKLDNPRAFTQDSRQLATFAFDVRSDIKTPGNAIAQAYILEGSLYVEVVYEKNNQFVSVAKEIAPLYNDEWFLLQVHFSTSDSNIQAWFQQGGSVQNVQWNDVGKILIPSNVFLNLGYNPVLNKTGADFNYKGVTIYAGVQTLYGISCDSSCNKCNGPNPTDCTSCNNGFYLDDTTFTCEACAQDCLTCNNCGTDKCTSCVEGKILVNGECICDASCLTCDGITARDCTSCPEHKVVVDGECQECDTSCAECSNPTATGCIECTEGYKVAANGTCISACDFDRCLECNENGSQCISCQDPKILFNGDCVSCDPSCKTCSGPENYQCLDCVSPAEFHEGKCFVCNETCQTCSGPASDECVTCSGEDVLIYGECLPPCDVDNGFFRSGRSCEECNSTCLTCQGPNNNDCLTCRNLSHVLDNGKCVPPVPVECDTVNGYVLVNNECIKCDINHGQALINDVCIDCDISCMTCDGPSDSNCLSCNNTEYILSNGKCRHTYEICDATLGMVINENMECVPCTVNCTNCSEGYVLNDNNECVLIGPECNQEDGYIIVNGDCVPCDYPCKTCSESTDNCLSCSDNYELNTNNNTCQPPCNITNGYVSINGECLACDDSCKTCKGTTYLDCVECASGLEFVLDECVEPCDIDNGYVRLNGQCLPCHDSCLTCSGTSNIDCLTCLLPNILQNGACVPYQEDCVAEDGFVLVNDECVSCEETCKTCNGISNSDCTSCFVPKVLSNGACVTPVPSCNTTEGEVLINGECFKCDESCKTCQGVEETDCTECSEGRVFEEGVCVLPCEVNNGFFKLNGACLPCDESCKTCNGSSASECTNCTEEDFLDHGRCYPSNCVNENYYFTETFNGSCSSDCDCDGTRRCSPYGECHDCLFLAKTFENIFTPDVCPVCNETCQTCRGSRFNDCFSCLSNEFLQDGECLPCDSSCATCNATGPYGCLTCPYTWVYNNNDRSCIIPCDTQNGFYTPDSRSCLPCDSTCKTCSGSLPTNCTSCSEGLVVIDGECLVPCNITNGFFYDENGTCQTCDGSCKTCHGVNDDDCDTCDDGDFLELGRCKPAKCVSYSYVFDESIINECNSDCECDGNRRCDPNGQCLDCHVAANLYPLLFNTELCPDCDKSCDTCRGPNTNDCTTCNEHYFLLSGVCVPCDESCGNCTGASLQECINCNETLVFRNGVCVQPCDTANGYFYDSESKCQSCDETCKVCTRESRKDCVECYGDYILDGGICKPPCDESSGYTYDELWNCVVCDESCLTCSGLGSENCTDCPEQTTLVGGRCVDCVSFYYTHDESTNSDGPQQCTSDCECDNTRRCSPNGVCEDCNFLAENFPSIYSATDCPQCNSSCLTCNGPFANNCTTCVNGEYLGVDNACYPCDISCETCDGPTAQECTSCPVGFTLDNGECVVPPIECDTTCKECNGTTPQNCTACGDDYDLINGECIHKNCISWDYFFDESSSPLGEGRCDDDCECDGIRRCSPTKYCSECLDLVSLFPEQFDLKDCPPCDENCDTCSGPSAAECTSCSSGYYLTLNNSCEVCDNNCAQCSVNPNNCTACQSGMKLNESHVCVVPCDSSCETCSGPSNQECITCPVDRTFVDGVCVITPVCVKQDYVHDEQNNTLGPNRCINDCDCDNTRRCSPDSYCRECMYLATLYPALYDQNECPACDETCLTCQGPSNANCTACQDGRVLIGGVCQLCDESCLTCNDVTANDCISCSEPNILSNGQCIIPPPVCDDANCLNCSGEYPGNCTKCADDYDLIDGYCVKPNCVSWDYTHVEVDGRCNDDCDCTSARRCSPDKYCQECDDLAFEFPTLYLPSDCPPCDNSCATCNGPNADDCLSCGAGYVLINGQCERCNDTCATCTGITNNDCLSCYEGYKLDGTQCVVPPPPCHNSCLTCSGSNATDCLTCPEGFRLAWDGTCQSIQACVKWGYSQNETDNELGPNRCYDDCECDGTRRCSPLGYCRGCLDLVVDYPNLYLASDCPVCHTSCLTCNQSTAENCTSCADGFVLVSGTCQQCTSPCVTCSVNPNECSSCEDGQILQNRTCVTPPPECDESCLTCDASGEGHCITCPDNMVLEAGYCVLPNCVAFNYTHNESNNTLGEGRCDDDCECYGSRRCSPEKYCEECFDLVKQFPTIYAHSDCPACEGSCLSCNGPLSSDCTTCTDGFILVDGTCVPCDSSCTTCRNPSVTGCITCPVGYDLTDNGTCTIHIDCDPTCLTCNGVNADQCLTCNENRTLMSGKCVLKCVNFDYTFEENADLSCDSDCECDGTRRCSLSSICDECQSLSSLFPSFFSPNDCPICSEFCSTCSGFESDDCISCYEGYFLADNGTCIKCNIECLTCDGEEVNSCTSCKDPLVIRDGYCVEPNPVCDESCATCFGPSASECTDCFDLHTLEDGYCVPINCVDWSYSFKEVTQTSQCISNCDCDGTRICGPNGVCGECAWLLSLYPNLYNANLCPICNETCLTCSGPTNSDCSSCQVGEVLINGECLPCDSSCDSCSGVAANQCVTCPSSKVLNSNNECVDPPPVCHESCSTCSGTSSEECTSCLSPLVLVNYKCIDPNTCLSFDYDFTEKIDHTCDNNCDCSGSRLCSPYGYCHECMYLAENFPEQFSTANCPACNSSCLTCDGPNFDDCISCSDGFYLTDNSTCEACDESCLTCNGATNANCTSCDASKLLDDGHCDTPPPTCHETCLECKGTLATDCISCPDNWELTEDGTCEKIDCIAFDYYHDETTNSEGPSSCSGDCDCNGARRCGPSGYCDSCIAVAEAYPSTYLFSDCPVCDVSCKDCDGPSSHNCTVCDTGISLFNGQCIQCYENCETCYGPENNNCLSCQEGEVLYQGQCFTPDPSCDPSCVTCNGTGANECTSCKCDQTLLNGVCIDNIIVCDESCQTCVGTAANQCRSCNAGRVLLGGECVVVSAFVGMRKVEDEPISYDVSKKYARNSDIGLGSWTKLSSYIEKTGKPYNLLFRLSGLTKSDKNSGNNKYRFSSLAVYYNATHYTFETYTKVSGTAVLVQKYIPFKQADIKNSWNLVFFGYSRKNARASGFVKLADGSKFDVEFTNVYQDAPEDKMEVFFYGDKLYNGFNGKVSSPEVLHGTNFLQSFGKANHKTYFKLSQEEI